MKLSSIKLELLQEKTEKALVNKLVPLVFEWHFRKLEIMIMTNVTTIQQLTE